MLYNLDINFLNDRDPSNLPPGGSNGPDDKGKPKAPIETKVPLMVGGAVMVILPLAALGYLLLLGQQQAKIKAEIQELDAKISTLEGQNEKIKIMENQLTQFNAQINALVSVFNQIKPMSAILEDIKDLTPPHVKIDEILQEEKKVIPRSDPSQVAQIPTTALTIKGVARSYNDVNDLLLVLQGSDFLNASQTRLQQAILVTNPINKNDFFDKEESKDLNVDIPQVVGFTIITEINQQPASDLLPNLTEKGAIGLVTRIRTLQEQGLINP